MYQRFIEEYTMNPHTMALIPVWKDRKIHTTVYEEGQQFSIPYEPLQVVHQNCLYYGSSFQGRKEGTRALIRGFHKLPIVIDPLQNLFIFPSASPQSTTNHWFFHMHINNYKESHTDDKHLVVYFCDGQTITLPISHYSFSNQMKRAASLQEKLMSRSTKSYFFMNEGCLPSLRGSLDSSAVASAQSNSHLTILRHGFGSED